MGKFIIFILAVIASAAGGTAYYLKVEAQRAELAEAVLRLADIKSEKSRKALLIIPKKQENSDLQAKVDLFAKVTAENETLDSQIPILETDLADVTREFMEAVSKVRTASVGMALPDVTLTSGQLLQGVRIVKITDTELTLAHNGGSARVPGTSLPADLRERLRIGMNPMVESEGTLASSAAAPSPSTAPVASADGTQAPVVASTETAPPAAPEAGQPATAQLTQSQINKIDEAETALRQQEKKEAELRRTRQAYLTQVQDYRIKDDRARFLGQPQRYQKVIPQITKAISDLDDQLTDTSGKIATLQVQVGGLKEGRVP